MPSRMIREGLLDSQRYWSVPIDARQLFVHLMLLADDFGLVSLAPVFIRRRAFADAPSQSKIDKLIAELERVDLLRTYEVEGVRYGFIPRFRQILRIEHAKHPMPPSALFDDDGHAREKFTKNKEKFEKLHSKRHADAKHVHRTQHTEVKRSEEKGIEEKGSEVAASTAEPETAPPSDASPPVEKAPNGNGTDLEKRAEALGITQHDGEPRTMFMLRVASEEAKARQEGRA